MDIMMDSSDGKLQFSLMLARMIRHSNPVIVCVGSDRVVSDMIGPLTAEFLVKNRVQAYVYGRLHNPIILKNIHSAFRYIAKKHQGRQVIIIDAGVGKFHEIGKVKLHRFGIVPAGAFGGSNVVYGDISVMPVVSTIGIDTKTFLSCTKFNVVYRLAKDIADGIIKALDIAYFLHGKTGQV